MLQVIKAPLPKLASVYGGPHCQLEFTSCWTKRLNNPLLNSLYKSSICYTERWYLETRRLINDELWYHPLITTLLKDQEFKSMLVTSAFIDGALMRSVINDDAYPEYQLSAAINLKKLNQWCSFFVSLPHSHETLSDLNGQSRS